MSPRLSGGRDRADLQAPGAEGLWRSRGAWRAGPPAVSEGCGGRVGGGSRGGATHLHSCPTRPAWPHPWCEPGTPRSGLRRRLMCPGQGRGCGRRNKGRRDIPVLARDLLTCFLPWQRGPSGPRAGGCIPGGPGIPTRSSREGGRGRGPGDGQTPRCRRGGWGGRRPGKGRSRVFLGPRGTSPASTRVLAS